MSQKRVKISATELISLLDDETITKETIPENKKAGIVVFGYLQRVKEMQTGLWIAAGLGLLVFVGVGCAMFLGLKTIPQLETIQKVEGVTDALGHYAELRREWFVEIKQLMNLFLQPILPIVASVVGYIFGVVKSTPVNDGQ